MPTVTVNVSQDSRSVPTLPKGDSLRCLHGRQQSMITAFLHGEQRLRSQRTFVNIKYYLVPVINIDSVLGSCNDI